MAGLPQYRSVEVFNLEEPMPHCQGQALFPFVGILSFVKLTTGRPINLLWIHSFLNFPGLF
jgi:hypothetical protein